MANKLGISVDINFQDIGVVDNKLKNLLKKLEEKNKINLSVDADAFKKIETQFNELKKKFEQSLRLNTDTSGLGNTISSLNKNLDNLEKKQVKIIDGEQVQLIEQTKKSLLETQKVIYDFNSNKITEVNTTDYAKNQASLYRQLNTLQNDEFAIKERLIGKDGEIKSQLEGQLSLIKQQQIEVGKLISQNNLQDDNKNNNLILERKQLISDLSISQEKFNIKTKEETIELEKQIANYKELMNIKLQNLQTKYGSLVKTDEVENFKKSLDSINTSNFDKGAISNEFKQIETNVKSSSSALRLAQKDASSFGDTLRHDAQAFAMWMVTGTLIMQSFKFFSEGTKYILDLNKSLTEISIVTNKSQDDVRQLGLEYANLAKQMSVSTKEIATASVEYYRQGLDQASVMERVKTTTQYAKISSLDFKQSTEILTATVNSMGVSIEKASDVFAYLGDATASGADEIGIAMSKVAGTANIAGVSLEKMSSWIAEISSKTRESAETVGFSLQSILSRYMQIKEKGFNEEDSTQLNDVVKALSSIGIKATDAKGQLIPFADALDMLGDRFGSLDKNAQAYILTTLAGTRQSSRLANLLNSYGDSVKLYNGALQSANTTTQKYNLWLEGTEAHLNQLKLAGTNIWQQVFNSNDIKTAIDLLTGLVNGVGWVTKTFGGLPVVIGGVTFALLMLNKSMSLETVKKYAIALVSLPMAYREAKAEGLGFSSALQALGISFDVAKIKAIAFQTVMSLGLSLVIMGVISGLTKLYNSFIDSEKVVETQKQKIEELTNSYNSLKSEIDQLKSIKNPTEDQKEYLKTLERELELKQQIIDIEKRKLIDKDVFGKGVWGKGMSAEIPKEVTQGQGLINNISSNKQLEEDATNVGDIKLADYYHQQVKESEDALQQLELKLIENKQTLQDYAKVAQGDAKQGIESMIDSINAILPKIQEQNEKTEKNSETLKENADIKKKNAESAKSMQDVEKEFAKSLNDNKDTIKEVNSLLDQHKKSNEWNYETILKLAQEYPDLLEKIGNEAELEKRLTEIKQEKVNAVTNGVKTQMNAEASLINSMAKGYGIDVENFRGSEESKLKLAAEAVKKRAAIFQAETRTISQSIDALRAKGSLTPEEQTQMDNMMRGAMRAGNLYASAQATAESMDTHLSNYLKLQTMAGSIGNFTSNIGSSNYDGKSNGKAEDEAKKAEELRNQMKEDVKTIEEGITEIIKKEFENRKKAIEDEYNKRKEALQKEKDLYNKQNSQDDYQKNLNKEQEILNGLNASITNAKRDSSLAGQMRLKDLLTQAKEQQDKIDQMVLEHSRDTNNQLFDDKIAQLDAEKEAQQKSLEDQYSDENIAKLVNSAMYTGQINGIGGVLDAYKNFQNTYNDGLTASGQLIQKEFIDKWQKVRELINGTSGVNIGVNFSGLEKLPSYAVGTPLLSSDQVANVHMNEAILPASLNLFRGGKYFDNFMNFIAPKLPNVSNIKSKLAPIINFNQPLVAVAGGINSEIDLNSFVDEATNRVTRKIMQNFNDEGIYQH